MPTTTCQQCTHFHPDPINPAAGMGQCGKGNGYWHPCAPHFCKQREATDAAA